MQGLRQDHAVAGAVGAEGSGFTLLFEALSLSLCREMPVRQAANQLRVAPKRLWRRVRHYVEVARAKDDMSGVRYVGIDETSVKRGHEYITVVHDLEASACCSPLPAAITARCRPLPRTCVRTVAIRGRSSMPAST